ncbi:MULTISPECIES: DNA primase [unclassified Helicobacter]|uniref:DNA primase n=1 Tax=unclassified Helicobacter TaxID=2593540 RepID=UPI000CF19A04|nr:MULTISPECIES: DNA primase [unclassified Helicobacter]
MIKNQSIESLKQQIDIVDIIGSYIDIKKTGSNYSACCPFHSEKTPSFMISPVKNIFHCYGCGTGGDAIKFVMEYEKIDFVEAIEKIAHFYNFELEYETSNYKKTSFQTEYSLLENILNFYHQQLYKYPKILDYLNHRGITQESIKKFKIGYCPPSFENIKFCDTNSLDKNKLVQLGVLGQDQGRYYARFNERIMFPIHSISAKPLGFGGRTLKDQLAKYINSPQSSIFNKSKLLYGYHLAKESIFRESKIIVTEGYLDVIMLHQAGFKNAVATLGTALTQEHIPLLNKGDPKIILSYDGDEAGIKAAYRASLLLAQQNKEGGVVIFDQGMDPADMVVNKKFLELKNKLETPIPFIEFILRQIAKQFNLNNPIQKEKALAESLKFLHTLSPLLQEEYKNLIAILLKIPPNLVITKYKKNSTQKNIQPTQPALFHQQDLLEELIIKYMLEDKSLLDFALDYIDEEVFKNQKEAFRALLQQDFSHQKLIGISLNPQLIITEDGFKKELILLILRYNYALLEEIQHSVLPFNEKSFKIRKIKNNILKLKKGELIAYESFGSF